MFLTSPWMKRWIQDRLQPQVDAMGNHRRRLLRRYLVRGDIDVLDIGTGGGIETLELLRRGNRVTVIEVDPDAVRRTRERIERNGYGARCQVLQMHARDLPGDQTFDEVVLCEVLEHVQEDKLVLERIAAVLRPRGRLVLSTPTALWGQQWKDAVSRTEDGGHVRVGYQGPELDDMLRRQRLFTIHRQYNAYVLVQWQYNAERLLRRLFMPLGALFSLGSRFIMPLLDLIRWHPSDQITIAIKGSARCGRDEA